MRKSARRSLLASAGLVALILVLTLPGLFFPGSGAFRNRIEASASRILGMELQVDGAVEILLFPSPGLRLEDTRLHNHESEWVKASAVELRLRARPLLRGKVEVDSVEVVNPDFQLRRNPDGAVNFFPANPKDRPDERRGLNIRSFRIRDADLTFTDRGSGKSIEAKGCDWTVRNLEWRSGGPEQSELHPPDFEGHLSCRSVTYDVIEVTGLEAEVSSQNRKLDIGPVTGTLFDGRLEARLESDLSKAAPSHSLELELADFLIERYIETFQQQKSAEGPLTLAADLSFSGKTPAEMIGSLEGLGELNGTGLVLHGLDLDKQLAQYKSTQRFRLVDVAAFFLAGPPGLAVTRGYGFAGLLVDRGERTPIQELISLWEIERGKARARDVALSTAENRLALTGGLDFVNRRFVEMRVVVVDPKGCAVVEQVVNGPFKDPKVERPHFLVTLVGPLVDLLKRGVGLLGVSECKPVYTGRLEHP